MKAVALDASGTLIDTTLPDPSPGPRDLLVEVKAVAVNPVDTKQAPPGTGQRVLGWDAAGVVKSVGSDCQFFAPGDTVYYAGDITRPGCFSQLHLVDERIVGRKPESLSFEEAAAMPLTTITAYEGLFHRLGLEAEPGANKGQTVLVISAAGGVGSIATQLAKLAGLTVIGTASRPESSQWALDHGCDHIINHFEPYAPQLEHLDIQQVNYALCLNNLNDHWDQIMAVLKPQGHVCSILPPRSGPLNFGPMMDKSITWSIELMYTRAKYETPDMQEQHELLEQVAKWVDDDRIQTTHARTVGPLTASNLQAAFDQLGTHRTIGKLVLSVS